MDTHTLWRPESGRTIPPNAALGDNADILTGLGKPLAPIRTFVRQPFTESGNDEKAVVQGVLDLLRNLNGQPYLLKVITGLVAHSQDTFRQSFKSETGLDFTPQNFRAARLRLLHSADAMIVVRTSLSESGAFEVAYNIFGGRKIPMFFAVWRQAPIKTTLLRDLDELCCASYVTFDHPEELRTSLVEFLATVQSRVPVEACESQQSRCNYLPMSISKGISKLFNQPSVSYSYQNVLDDDKRKDHDAPAWIEDLSPEVRELWLERVQWLRLIRSLVEYDILQKGNYYRQFKQEWKNLVSKRIIARKSEFYDLFNRMDQLWFRQQMLPDWNTIKAWDNYMQAIDEYHKPGLVIETLTQHDFILERLSGSLFQVLPFANKRYWNEVRYFGLMDQVYNNISNLAADALRSICYFPEELLKRYNLRREQFLDGSCINKPEYQELMHYWLDVYLPQLKQRTHRLLVAPDLHPSWLVLLGWKLELYSKIESTFRWCNYDYTIK